MSQETQEPTPWVVRSFRITTYFKRKRGEPGITQLASKRMPIAVALEWVLQELPDEAWDVEHRTSDIKKITIDWSKVPDRGMR